MTRRSLMLGGVGLALAEQIRRAAQIVDDLLRAGRVIE